MEDYQRLLKNLLALGLIALFVIAAIYLYSKNNRTEFTIDDTGIKVESIKSIAEISTISYRDEIVVDTVEYYKESPNIMNPLEWPDLYNKTVNKDIKRRLTLIIRGEVKYGIDLSDKNYRIEQNDDTVWLFLPTSEVLDVIVTPSETEVFEEAGDWDDGTRKQLEAKALSILRSNAETFDLTEKANQHAEQLFRKLVQAKKEFIIQFE